MATEQFCLRWNNFQINITSALESLKCDEDLVDVTLTCDGQNVKAHKVILSACSPYFKTVFKENPCQHPVVILKDTHYEDVKALLNFMYQGEVYIAQDRLASFLHTAELLQVRGLAGATNPFREQQQQQAPPPPPRPRKPVPSFSPVSQQPQQISRCSGSSVFTSNFEMETSVDHLSSPDNTCVSHPSSPHCDGESSPTPLSKRRKAFPRFGTVHSPVSSDKPLSPAESLVSPPPPPNKDTEIISIIKTEPTSDIATMRELDTSLSDRGGPQISSPSEETECYVDDEDSSLSEKDDLAAEMHSSPPPTHQQQSVLMQTLSNTVSQVQAEDVGRFKCSPIYQRSHWNSMQPRACHICNKTFSNSFNMKQHIQNVHLPAQMVKCQICRKSFKNKRYLRKHLVKFHGAPLRRIHTQEGQIIHIRESYN